MIQKIIFKGLLLSFFRCLVGATFIVSGLIKGNDSVGFSYKLVEYFQDGALAYRVRDIFGWDSFSLECLVEYALFLAIFISIFEIVLGFSLIVRAKINITLFFVFSLLVFFSFLTLHTATCVEGFFEGIKIECVKDCGCFGDAMRDSLGRSLLPWESFIKDVLLILFTIPIIFFERNKGLNSLFQDIPSILFSFIFTCIWCIIFSWYFPFIILLTLFIIYFFIKKYYSSGLLIVFSTTLVSSIFVGYTLNNLPLKDYRPFKKGVDLKEFFNDFDEIEKNQEILSIYHEFSDNNVTRHIIRDSVSVILSSSYHYNKTNKSSYQEISDLFQTLKNTDIAPIQISDYQNRDSIRTLIGEDVLYYYGDSDVGKIIVRSDPGIILIKDGVILKKWHYNNIPSLEEIQDLLN